ncbi:MAG: choice-of-anchor X domain-containing protein [Bacteroidota bacterium]
MRSFITICVFFIGSMIGFAQQGPAGEMNNDQWDFISTNRMLQWVSNNGRVSHDPLSDGAGLEWPAGSGKYLVFTEGMVYGAKIQGEVRVGGATYIGGLQAGSIRPDGQADDPNAPWNRIFRAHCFDAGWWSGQSPASQAQILADLMEWPVQFGAPFLDINGNGVYEPDSVAWQHGGVCDIPRIPGDEALWYVSNDLNPRRVRDLYGSNPMGMEIQTMVWASSGHPLLDNVIFREYTLINKGILDFEEMVIGAWDDPDMGEPYDDLCGVDTALGLAYTYNGIRDDEVYGIPPATGTVWLQTPVVPQSGSTAQFGLGRRQDFANLPLSAFVFYVNGSSVYMDPALKQPVGATQMMNNLNGKKFNGEDYLDPITGLPTPTLLAGDPVLGKGWIGGIVNKPDDARFLSSCGPFTLATRDTQKVIFARVAVDGGNNLLSVRSLRNATRQLQDIYRNLPMGAPAPVFTWNINQPAGLGFELHVTAGPFPEGTSNVQAVLQRVDGSRMTPFTMFDDGSNGDLISGDGIYSILFTTSPKAEGADLFVMSMDAKGEKEWFVDSEIPIVGPATVSIAEIVSDSRNFDGIANPGENIRTSIRFENHSAKLLGPWHLFLRDSVSLNAEWTVLRHPLTTIADGSSETVYDPGDKNTYLAITIPEDFPVGTTFRMPVTLISENYCLWIDTLEIAVEDYDTPPTDGLLDHVEGRASGSLGYSLIDPTTLTDHDYRVSVEGEDFGVKTLHIEDVTLGTTLARGVSMPERWAHDGTTIDGWRLTMGTTFDQLVYDQNGEKLESFKDGVKGKFSEPTRAWFTIYNGGGTEYLMAGEDFFNSRFNTYDLFPVRLVFDRNNGQKAMRYVRGSIPNYGYQGYYDIPVRAYDVSDTANPRQITLGFLEQINRPGADSSWMPTADPNDRDILFLFADDYTGAVDPKYEQPINTASANLDFLYCVWGLRDASLPMFVDGDSYTITPRVPVSNRDVYIFPKPKLLGVSTEPTQPAAIALHANYPNPFGSGSASGSAATTISFDTPTLGHARVAVYDMLGRCVATVVDQTLPAGTHSLSFNAASLRAGSYLLALETNGARCSRMITVVK